jgi:SPP1 Gp6-like portal protein
MPLPAGGNTPWPPTSIAPVTARLSTWSAWYSGDPEQLSLVYGGMAGNDATGAFASERGGWKAAVKRTVQRWFWGARPLNAGEQRTKLHVPIAADIASTSADLLFSEPPTLKVEDTATQTVLDDLVEEGLHATLLEAAEIAAALGGVYLRVCWDTEYSDRPWLAAVHPDAAVPEWQWGRLAAVTFWRVLADDGRVVVRHLERHEPGRIMHAVYEGDRDVLGRRVELTAFPQTQALADAITQDDDTIATGVDRMTAVYVPNMRPNRLWRNLPDAAPLGRSDYAGVEPLMDALDETYSSWMRDIRLGKGRLIVPRDYLQPLGPGKGAAVDLDREVYEALNTMGGEDGRMALTVAQFAIRVDEHSRTATELLTRIVAAGGYSAQTFGLTGDVAVTATEVTARERRSMITRDRKTRYCKPELADIVETLLAVYRTVFAATVTPARPKIKFGDSVSESPEALAQTAQLLRAAEAASTRTLVELVHPDWDKTQIDAEVQTITAEKATMVPAPDTPPSLDS